MQLQVRDLGPGQAEGRSWGAATPRDMAQCGIFSYCFAKHRSQEECEVFLPNASRVFSSSLQKNSLRRIGCVTSIFTPNVNRSACPWQVEGDRERLLSFCLLIIFFYIFNIFFAAIRKRKEKKKVFTF